MKTSIHPCTFKGLPWPQLISGTLLRRYKRFLADVQLENGDTVTAHCPNTGSMKGCSEPGRTVYLSVHNNPKRKFYFIQRMHAEVFKPADHIDAAYGRELRRAVKKGLEMLANDVLIDFDHIRLHRSIPCEL